MNRSKKANDNGQIDSFFNRFKVASLKRKPYSVESVVRGIFNSYVRYYNYEHSHSSIGYVSAIENQFKKMA